MHNRKQRWLLVCKHVHFNCRPSAGSLADGMRCCPLPTPLRMHPCRPAVQIASEGGYVFGTLCMLHFEPRQFSAEEYGLLAHFAEIVTRELERDWVGVCAKLPRRLLLVTPCSAPITHQPPPTHACAHTHTRTRAPPSSTHIPPPPPCMHAHARCCSSNITALLWLA